jgi:hypothetical protein
MASLATGLLLAAIIWLLVLISLTTVAAARLVSHLPPERHIGGASPSPVGHLDGAPTREGENDRQAVDLAAEAGQSPAALRTPPTLGAAAGRADTGVDRLVPCSPATAREAIRFWMVSSPATCPSP